MIDSHLSSFSSFALESFKSSVEKGEKKEKEGTCLGDTVQGGNGDKSVWTTGSATEIMEIPRNGHGRLLKRIVGEREREIGEREREREHARCIQLALSSLCSPTPRTILSTGVALLPYRCATLSLQPPFLSFIPRSRLRALFFDRAP